MDSASIVGWPGFESVLFAMHRDSTLLSRESFWLDVLQEGFLRIYQVSIGLNRVELALGFFAFLCLIQDKEGSLT